MRRVSLPLVLCFAASCCAPAILPGNAPSGPLAATVSNAMGMEFVLIQPGSMVVGKFQPVCPIMGPAGTPIFPPLPGVQAAGAGGGGGAPPAGGAGAGAQAGAGGQPAAGAQPGGGGGGGQAAAPRDPRTFWTSADAALCGELVARDASPGFTVTIDRPFYLGKFEVTQAQWRAVMGSNPSVFQASRVTDDADLHPVDNIAWADAQAFIRRLNELDRTAEYRLPTEFEWEYAARAGAPADMTWAAARAQSATGRTTFRVGTKTPNAWGLYDMTGNVWEWVEDFYNEKIFADPIPPRTGSEHVLKGASAFGDVKNLTWTTHAGGPGNGFDNGFRVVREAR